MALVCEDKKFVGYLWGPGAACDSAVFVAARKGRVLERLGLRFRNREWDAGSLGLKTGHCSATKRVLETPWNKERMCH